MNEYSALDRYGIALDITPTTLTVAASGGDFTTIKAAMAEAAAHATKASPYRLYVRNGTYNEIQIAGADWVTIEGESQAGVVMISDGLRTDVDPVSGQRYVDMAQDTKHGFKINHSMTLKNFTIRVNDVKYCIHSDDGTAYNFALSGMRLEHSNGFPLGVGARNNQNITLTGCYLKKLGASVAAGNNGSHGIFWHNWNNETGPCKLTLNGCTFDTCGMISFLELGSNHKDLVRIENCVGADKANYFDVTELYYTPEGTKAQVPYCINQLLISSPTAAPIVYSETDRADLLANSVYIV